MNSQTVIRLIVTFFIYLLLQIVVLRNFVFFDVAFCFVYIACILLLPDEIPPVWIILISFLTGLLVDIFYNTAGVHASASVLIGYLRGYIIKFLFPTKGIENEIVISLKDMGAERFVRYVAILTLIHHSTLFFVEAGGFAFFLITILKIICSVVFTSFMIIILQYVRGN
jgi:rod shape-determining protein MreD